VATALRIILVVVFTQESFGMVEQVDAELAAIKVRWWDPFSKPVFAFAGFVLSDKGYIDGQL
jgi:hypothetical protein